MVLSSKIGWGYGTNITSGREGVFPIGITREANNRGSTFSVRTQSLIAPRYY
jgi:hypothetical protein